MPTTPTAVTLPIGRVHAIVDLARRRGWDTAELLADAGIAPQLLTQGRARVTVGQTVHMVQQLWRSTDDELFGLGRRPMPRGTFRLVCFALLGSRDIAAALHRFRMFQKALPGFPPLQLTTDGREARISFDITDIRHPHGLIIDTLLMVVYRFLDWAVGGSLRLLRVEVPYPPADLDDYDVIFGAPVRFSAPHPALVFDAAVLAAPLVRDEDDLMRFLRNAPEAVIGRGDYSVSTAARVRRILERGGPGQWPSVEQIAAELAVSPATLRRKLRDEHTSPSRIREQILRDAAIAALVRGEPVGALSRRLGFSEPSAFSRAFRRWTGSPPGSYRSPGAAS
ncbi:AraC family transcriptional regulator [Nocardia veterana]|uniref:AraC family transcriptional regulator n=1 Tax=Nocardia veterana TaxID=132249 RepID=A0A7X6LXV9_9NOCA|nr:AraC family transcriptional regulator [Nocardia veterana]NKY86568.1 AraC family transcriptional regulator [Nocardia veterana]